MQNKDVIHVDGQDYYGFLWKNCSGKFVAYCPLKNTVVGGFKTIHEAIQYLVNEFVECDR